MKAEIGVAIACDGWRAALPGAAALCRRAGAAALAANGCGPEPVEIGVLLADDEAVADLNAAYRGRTGATNVLSFAGAGAETGNRAARRAGYPALLGDVVLAFETVAAEAERDARPIAAHTAHLVVHGVLHLLGHDHEEDDDAARMQVLERTALARLGLANPYAPAHAPAA